MANFKYSTPDRRIGSRTLSFLPTEIYMEIINYFQPSERTSVGECKRVLSNLARVCRFFCAVALRKMYQTLEFSGDMYSPTTEPSYSPFCATLNKTSIKGDNSVHPDSDVRFAVEVSQFVRACVFADWSMEGSQRRWSSPFLENFSNAILRMPHLESIRLERTALTQQLIRAIAKSQKLKTLCIRSCTLDPALISPKFAGISSLELSTLEYFDSPALGVEPSMIRLQQLEVFRTDSPKFGQYFLKRDHPHLHTLELRIVEDLELLYSFLARTPSITELAINSIVAKSGGPPPTLPPSALSNIHTVHVSLSFLGHFQKRPLRKVSLNTGQFRNWSSEVLFAPALPLTTMDDLAPLIRSASSITELNIPQHIYFVFPLHKHTKNLEALALAYDHPNYTTIPAYCLIPFGLVLTTTIKNRFVSTTPLRPENRY
ncbi:hypothetical protein C8J57DRAFT_200782 [Mycena rebaudengoi]|nr:hypothetical protein C8J57DRAFT_200782 [Mycena rebaudengoi]